MRAGDRYACAKCAFESVYRTTLCDPLCRHARDENGNAPPSPIEQRFEWYEGLEHIGPALVRPVFLLGVVLGRARRKRQPVCVFRRSQ